MRVKRAEFAVYDARALGLLKRWQEHLVLCGDVDAIARPHPHRMAAFLGDEAEAIPLSLEDPPFVVEGFVDECGEHRFIGGIHASCALSYPQPTALGEFCKPWPPLEPQPLWWRPWFCRSTRGRWVKSRKSFRSSRRLPARQRSATPSSRRYLRRSASP